MACKNPLVSVVVPVYKVEQYLDVCVCSIVNQTYKNLEIILVDDGSPDHCGEMCDRWEKKDHRICVLHKQNGGLSSARNAGIKIARGQYIGFVDSDDSILPLFIETLLEVMIHNEHLAMAGCMIWEMTGNEKRQIKEEWHIDNPQTISYNDIVHDMFQYKFGHYAWNKLYRADLVKQVPFREGRNNEDTLFLYDFSKLMVRNKLNYHIIPDYLYNYTIRNDSICRDENKLLIVDKILNYRDIANDLLLYNPSEANDLRLFWQTNIVNVLNGCLYNKTWYSQYYQILNPILQSEVNLIYMIKNRVEKRILLRLLKLKYIPFLASYIRHHNF